MRRRLMHALALLPILAAGPLSAQTDYRSEFTFAAVDASGRPANWGGAPPATISVDSAIVRSAPYAARLERTSETPGGDFSSIVLRIPVTFTGDSLELRGWLRTRDVTGFAGLWLREDGSSGSVQFDNMERRQLRGTTEWTQYVIRLPLDRRARDIYVGALMSGTGTLWVDDIELLVDGRPLTDAPAITTGPRADREFDAGSRIDARPLTPQQVANLALLGRVWGFVKYHHPTVTGGAVNWDYELFRIMPAVLDARDRAAAAAAMANWLSRLGDAPRCDPCAQPVRDAHLAPETDWIRDRALLGAALSERLTTIHANRHAVGAQHFVGQVAGVGNPDFSAEEAYGHFAVPDAGYRLLALFRFWNIIAYWFPYRDLIGEDWDAVLSEFVPKLMAEQDRTSYRLAMMQLSARIHDTHSNLWADLGLRPPQGDATFPVKMRFVDGAAVVTEYLHPELGPATGLRPGDVIERLNGAAVDSLVVAWRPYYSASNEPTRLRDIAQSLTRGAAGPVRVHVRRGGERLELTANRVPMRGLDMSRTRLNDLPGETFQRLTHDVAYLKLSSVKVADVPDYLRRAEGAQVLVIDIRNYPSEFVVFALGSRLVRGRTEFARFTVGDLANPGAFAWGPTVALAPVEPGFAGKVVILVDEMSLSQAEYTAMAFRVAPGAIVAGSTTAGADGNVSPIPLPGGAAGMISGIGVFYPDRRPTQRVGILPDVHIEPTIDGIRAGRDEVLERAVSHALGREFRLPPRER